MALLPAAQGVRWELWKHSRLHLVFLPAELPLRLSHRWPGPAAGSFDYPTPNEQAA